MENLKLIEKLNSNKELQKNISKLGGHYNSETFLKDAKSYISAIKDGRMINSIGSVSSSGMSRTMKFLSCERSKYQHGQKNYYRNYFAFFVALGHNKPNNSDFFRVNGCGMDMVFSTNYNNIHQLKYWGIITKKQADKLCQQTPNTI